MIVKTMVVKSRGYAGHTSLRCVSLNAPTTLNITLRGSSFKVLALKL